MRPLRLRRRRARAADQAAIAAGTTGYALMQGAGRAAFDALRARWPTAHTVGIVCGTGNNGGDGFVVGTLARTAGCAVDLVVIGDESRIGGDAARARAAARAAGLVSRAWTGRLPAGEILVDALFGTGLTRAPAGDAADAVAAMNADTRPVLAVDVPSGLDASTGYAPGAAVAATLTVTFIVLKTGLLTGAGPALCGELRFAPLDVAGHSLAAVPPGARYSTVRGPRSISSREHAPPTKVISVTCS